jgi:hypothetical protein
MFLRRRSFVIATNSTIGTRIVRGGSDCRIALKGYDEVRYLP